MTEQEINAILQGVTTLEDYANFLKEVLQVIDWEKEIDHNQIHHIKCGTMEFINLFPLKQEPDTATPKEETTRRRR